MRGARALGRIYDGVKFNYVECAREGFGEGRTTYKVLSAAVCAAFPRTLQQTAADCVRLQQTATDCVRLLLFSLSFFFLFFILSLSLSKELV